jgi:hypothetical protein
MICVWVTVPLAAVADGWAPAAPASNNATTAPIATVPGVFLFRLVFFIVVSFRLARGETRQQRGDGRMPRLAALLTRAVPSSTTAQGGRKTPHVVPAMAELRV